MLAIGFVLISFLARSWDDLVAHVALGIAIGLVLASALFIPRQKDIPNTANPTGSIPKTVVFWSMLVLLAVFVYQLVRGPGH